MRREIALVTGGAGFIGSHMVDLLVKRGYSVRVIDNLSGGHENNLAHHVSSQSIEFLKADIRTISPNHSIFSDLSYIFHFAGIGDIVPSIERPIEYFDVNVLGTVRMLEAARAAGVKKFVYAASSSCYGVCTQVPTPEDQPLSPEYPYALSKLQGEQSSFHWHKVYNLPVNSIRIFNAYGPRVRTTGAYGAVFGVFLKQKLAGSPLTVVGDGSQRRDFVFVTDVAKAFLCAAETELVGQIYNVGAGKPQPINYLVELLDVDDVEYVPKRPGEPDCTWADVSKIQQELGWRSEVPFEEGVRAMLEDIIRWSDAPLWTSATIAEATRSWFSALGRNDEKNR